MIEEVFVHPHALKHGLTEHEVIDAWRGGGPRQTRVSPHEDEVVGIGWTRDGRDVQLVGIVRDFGTLVIHAMHPVTKTVMMELGLTKGGRHEDGQ